MYRLAPEFDQNIRLNFLVQRRLARHSFTKIWEMRLPETGGAVHTGGKSAPKRMNDRPLPNNVPLSLRAPLFLPPPSRPPHLSPFHLAASPSTCPQVAMLAQALCLSAQQTLPFMPSPPPIASSSRLHLRALSASPIPDLPVSVPLSPRRRAIAVSVKPSPRLKITQLNATSMANNGGQSTSAPAQTLLD